LQIINVFVGKVREGRLRLQCCVRRNDFIHGNTSLLEKLAPRRLSPTASAALAAKLEAMHDEPFANVLNRWIERKGLDPVAVYKGAGVTKQVWAKLRSAAGGRRPNKDTALALAVGFRMTPEEADEFLSSAGYAFSPSSRRDAIVRFYLANADWDILGVNSALFEFGEKPLGER
jgi:hypothetical protein